MHESQAHSKNPRTYVGSTSASGGRRTARPLIQLLIATLIVLAASPAHPQKIGKESEETIKAEQEVRQAENERVKALLHSDAKEIDRLYADDYFITLGNGAVVGKAEELALYTTGSRKTQSWKPDDVKVRVYGDTAVITGRAHVKDILRGQSRDFQFRFTDVWVKQDGRWRKVSRHGTRIADSIQVLQLFKGTTDRSADPRPTSIPTTGQRDKKADPISKVEQEVRQVDNERNDALVHNDTTVLDHIWADDLTLTNSRGEVHSKAQRIADIKSGTLKFGSYMNDDILVRIYGDTAVMTGRSTASYLEKGSDISHQTRFTRVYVKRQGHWRLVAQQTSIIVLQ